MEEETAQETENDVTVVRRKTPKPKRIEPKLDYVLDALKYKVRLVRMTLLMQNTMVVSLGRMEKRGALFSEWAL